MTNKITMVKRRVRSPVSDLAAIGDSELERYALKGARFAIFKRKVAPICIVILTGCVGVGLAVNYLDALRPLKDTISAGFGMSKPLQVEYKGELPRPMTAGGHTGKELSSSDVQGDLKVDEPLTGKVLSVLDGNSARGKERIERQHTLLVELGKKANVSLFRVYQSTKDANLFYLQAAKGSLIVYVTKGEQLVAAPVRTAFDPLGEGFAVVDVSLTYPDHNPKEEVAPKIELPVSKVESAEPAESLSDVPRLTPEGILAPIPYDITSDTDPDVDASKKEWSGDSHDVVFSQFDLEKIRGASILFPHLGRDLKGSVITLFDPQCHFCGMFLKEIQTYQSAGLDVYLLSLPLKGVRSRNLFVAAMCDQYPQGAIQSSVKLHSVPPFDKMACTDPSSLTWDLVISKIDTQFKIKGTPFFFMSNDKSGGLSDVRHFRDALR